MYAGQPSMNMNSEIRVNEAVYMGKDSDALSSTKEFHSIIERLNRLCKQSAEIRMRLYDVTEMLLPEQNVTSKAANDIPTPMEKGGLVGELSRLIREVDDNHYAASMLLDKLNRII